MQIDTYPTILTLDEANKIAQKQGTPLSKFVIKKGTKYQLEKLYVEYKIIEYQLTFKPNAIAKLVNKVFRKESFESKSKIKVIGNGSTGSVAIVADMPEITNKTVKKEEIQYTLYEDEQFVEKGRKAVSKLVRRQTGGFPEMTATKITSIFRPFYIAYYGEMEDGKKVRYLPIAADGCSNRRTN